MVLLIRSTVLLLLTLSVGAFVVRPTSTRAQIQAPPLLVSSSASDSELDSVRDYVNATGALLFAGTSSVPAKKMDRNFWDVIFTKLDAPLRTHSVSAGIGTFGGIAWISLMFASMYDFALPLGDDFIKQATLAVLFASYCGLIYSGTKFLPKGSRYKYYREAYLATDLIMAADLLLWLAYSGGVSMDNPFVAVVVSFVAVLGILGDVESIAGDTPLRKEFYENGFMDEAIANPVWKHIAVLPTHTFLAFTKVMGVLHLAAAPEGATHWLETHSHLSSFASAWYMTMLLVSSWSTFVQGTMPFRKVPFNGKQFRLDFDFDGMAMQLAPFLPLVPPAFVGFSTGLLQEFYTFNDILP